MPAVRRPAEAHTPRSPLARQEAPRPGPSVPSYLRTRPRSLSQSASVGRGAEAGAEGLREEHRECVAREVLQTERDYVAHLATCVRVFMDPLTAAADLGKPVVRRDDIATIFRNIRDVYMAHVGLLGELERRIPAPGAPWDPAVHFGDVFFHFVSAFFPPLSHNCWSVHIFTTCVDVGDNVTYRKTSLTRTTYTRETTRSPHAVWTLSRTTNFTIF